MTTRRDFLAKAAMSTVGAAFAVSAANAEAFSTPHILGSRRRLAPEAEPLFASSPSSHYVTPTHFGLGGVPIGTGFSNVTSEQSDQVMATAWSAGVRYFDTSPWYGLGLSERRMGHFLGDQKRSDFVLSTKVGRILTPTEKIPKTMWKAPSSFAYHYDYSADGVRRSIEDSLQRLGLPHLDIVYIHDLSPDNDDLGAKWEEAFDVAANGAMMELTKMRNEGLIKAWGLGVNTIEPCLKALDVADPDIFLSATQYSLINHKDSLDRLFPKCEARGVHVVVGAPLNAGFLAGRDRYDYRGKIPDGAKEKRAKISAIAKDFGTDLRTAALQFSNAPKSVCAIIPGASSAVQVAQNVTSMTTKIKAGFWEALKRDRLIADNAPVPS